MHDSDTESLAHQAREQFTPRSPCAREVTGCPFADVALCFIYAKFECRLIHEQAA
jgi:hypothetical protein